MAMTMNGEVQLAAPREVVWAKLNDPEVLKACIPGCEELERTEDNGFRAVAKMKVGPVKASFKGQVTLTDLDPPNGYKISGEGEGGVAGFAKGGATVTLTDKDGGTLLTYNVEAQIGGKLAQLGQRLVNGVAKKLADEFFAKFATAVRAELDGRCAPDKGSEPLLCEPYVLRLLIPGWANYGSRRREMTASRARRCAAECRNGNIPPNRER